MPDPRTHTQAGHEQNPIADQADHYEIDDNHRSRMNAEGVLKILDALKQNNTLESIERSTIAIKLRGETFIDCCRKAALLGLEVIN